MNHKTKELPYRCPSMMIPTCFWCGLSRSYLSLWLWELNYSWPENNCRRTWRWQFLEFFCNQRLSVLCPRMIHKEFDDYLFYSVLPLFKAWKLHAVKWFFIGCKNFKDVFKVISWKAIWVFFKNVFRLHVTAKRKKFKAQCIIACSSDKDIQPQ